MVRLSRELPLIAPMATVLRVKIFLPLSWRAAQPWLKWRATKGTDHSPAAPASTAGKSHCT